MWCLHVVKGGDPIKKNEKNNQKSCFKCKECDEVFCGQNEPGGRRCWHNHEVYGVPRQGERVEKQLKEWWEKEDEAAALAAAAVEHALEDEQATGLDELFLSGTSIDPKLDEKLDKNLDQVLGLF